MDALFITHTSPLLASSATFTLPLLPAQPLLLLEVIPHGSVVKIAASGGQNGTELVYQ